MEQSEIVHSWPDISVRVLFLLLLCCFLSSWPDLVFMNFECALFAPLFRYVLAICCFFAALLTFR